MQNSAEARLTRTQDLHGGQNLQEDSHGPEEEILSDVGKSQDVPHFCDVLCISVSMSSNKRHYSTCLELDWNGLVSPLGDILSPGASRVRSKSSARREI